jgi:hypothetical protein
MTHILFNENASVQLKAYEQLYVNSPKAILASWLIVWEYEKPNAVEKQLLMDNFAFLKTFFTCLLMSKMTSDNYTQEGLQTSDPVLYLSLVFGLVARSLYLAYANIHQEFFNWELWKEIAKYPEEYGFPPPMVGVTYKPQ